MKKLLLSLALLPLMAIAGNVKSPNGNIELKFSVDQTGRPVYEMSYKGRAVVKPSFLGLELAKDKHASAGLNETDLMDGFSIKDEKLSEFDETWQPVWGETKNIRNHYNVSTAAKSELFPDQGRAHRVCYGRRPHGMVAARRLRHSGAGDSGMQALGDS